MTAIDCARRAAEDGCQAVRLRPVHRLIITSMHDTQAQCTCGRWRYLFSGRSTKKHGREEFKLHAALPGRPEDGRHDPLEYDCKPWFTGNKRGWVALDSFSASAIVAVYDALNEENKAKFGQLRIDRMAKVAFKFVK